MKEGKIREGHIQERGMCSRSASVVARRMLSSKRENTLQHCNQFVAVPTTDYAYNTLYEMQLSEAGWSGQWLAGLPIPSLYLTFQPQYDFLLWLRCPEVVQRR